MTSEYARSARGFAKVTMVTMGLSVAVYLWLLADGRWLVLAYVGLVVTQFVLAILTLIQGVRAVRHGSGEGLEVAFGGLMVVGTPIAFFLSLLPFPV